MADDVDTSSDEIRVVDTLYWWGIPTLFRAPHNRDPSLCDIALIGVPHSTGNGTTERDQHLGPRAVRHVSANGRRVHNAFNIDPWSLARIHDLGDVPLPEANDNERCIERISAFLDNVQKAGTRPLAIGGDHSITGAILQAIAGPNSQLTGGKKAALLHFDAHTDAFRQSRSFSRCQEISGALGGLSSAKRPCRSSSTAFSSAFAVIPEPWTGCSRASIWAMR